MTTTPATGGTTRPAGDVQAAIDAGTRTADPTTLTEGQRYAFVVPDGGRVHVVDNDLDEFRPHPRRKTGTVTVLDAAAFTAYVNKHALPETEVWANPTSADMLELAQTFNANRSVRFESSRRVKSGETQLVYKEDETATAGRKGDIAIPDRFTLALRPYEGSEVYKVTARLRYRIHEQTLRLGYVLDRPEDVQRAAFTDAVTAVADGITQPIWNGTPS